jgi:hypothetical protein
MSGLFSAVGRGLSTAGYAAGDMYAKGALMDQESELTTQRAMRLAEFQEALKLKSIPATAKATADAELATAPARAEAKSILSASEAADLVKNAPNKAAAMLAGELSPEVVKAKAGQVGAEAEARSKAETKGLIDRGNDPTAVRAVRNLAQAQHVEGLGSVTQAKLAQLSIDEKEKVSGLIDEFETTTDPKRKAQIKESLTVRGIIKPGEYDTEKVTEEKTDKDGNVIKTERTQKRRPDGAAPEAAGKNGWDSATGEVYKGGKVVGKAANEKEARSVYGGGAPAPASVAGRPMYDKPTSELTRLSAKPKGVSTEEANAARAELEARKGESRIGAF